MRNVGALAQFERQQVPPIKVPAVHARERPLTLNPLLDPACELCLLPIPGPGWYDYSGNGYFGTLTNAVWTDNGRFGPAMSFDGLNDWVGCTVSPLLNFVAGDFSIELWVNPTAFGAVDQYITRGAWNADGYMLRIMPGGLVDFRTFQAAANQVTNSAVGAIALNNWHHLIITRQGAGCLIYVNGVDVTAAPGVHINPVGNALRQFIVGLWAGASPTAFIDLVRVYSRLLVPYEVADLSDQGRPQWMG